MARSNRILAVDIGAASIKIAEFEYPSTGGIVISAFDYREYGEEFSEDNRSVVITSLLQDMLQNNNFSAGKALICISGQFVLTRFVKLPPVAEEESRVRQIIEFEARQNVPFPMEEVIWDYQLIANPEAEELEVMFVVVKNEIVEEITNAVQNAGLATIAVDVAPCACYNAARANDIGDEECEMILDIGDRSTNLLFADRQQFFARTIPIAGHTITQQIAKEFGIAMDEAEEMKRRHGFVALGGAYAEPESEVASAVSKIVRNVMTRLHGEINRSIGVYRAQQKGNTPVRLYLTGGSSTMNYTDVFFNEKLDMDVEFLNPFKVMQLAPGIDAERLQGLAHMFSEVIGLGLRHCRQMPVEVSLIPATIKKQIAVRQKKPYLFACVACILIILALALLGGIRKSEKYEGIYEDWQEDRVRLQRLEKKFSARLNALNTLQDDLKQIRNVLKRREQWPAVINEIERLGPDNLWIYSVEPVVQERIQERDQESRADEIEEEEMRGSESLFGGGIDAPSREGRRSSADTDSIRTELRPGVLAEVILRGHSLEVPESAKNNADADGEGGAQDADDETAAQNNGNQENRVAEEGNDGSGEDGGTPEQIFERRLRQSDLFDAEETRIESYTRSREVDNMTTFTLRVKLTTPLTGNYAGQK